MRSDLQKIAGVSDIETDFRTRICKFNFSIDKTALLAKLDEFAKTNSHISGWSVVDQTK